MFTQGDAALEAVDALGGLDTVVGDLSSAASVSGSGLYQGFEQVELTGSANQWSVTAEDVGLLYVNAVGGVDTLSFASLGSGVVTNASEVGADRTYRNFEQVVLTGGADRWQWSERDESLALSRIDGAGGSDTLEVDGAGGAE